MTRKLLVASPIEPSGASWILNCLLELGVKVHHRPVERNVFRRDGGMWASGPEGETLHPRAAILEKWMPTLARGPFVFRRDVEVEYVQEPPPADSGEGALLFVRDPRDAIWSAYRRDYPEIPFERWIELPHPRSLLDRAAHWAFFVRSWLARPFARAFRFEDYKADDEETLADALAHLGIEASREEIARAASASTFEKAREGEARYRERHPGDAQVANRAGRVGDYRERPELATALARIEARASDVLLELGYDSTRVGAAPHDGFGLARTLGYYRALSVPPELAQAASRRDPGADPRIGAALAFGRSLDAGELGRAHVAAHEARLLCDSLGELAPADDAALRERLAAVRAAFADGGAYHRRQLAELLRSRRGGGHG